MSFSFTGWGRTWMAPRRRDPPFLWAINRGDQPIHPGSYILAEKPLDDRTMPGGLTLEVWIRRWRTVGRQAILGQFDEPESCGFGLFVNADGSLGFYVGDGGRYDERRTCSKRHPTSS